MPTAVCFHHEPLRIDGISAGIAALWQDRSLLAISLSPDRTRAIEHCLESAGIDQFHCAPLPPPLARNFQDAFAGKRVHWRWSASPRGGTDFQRRIWKLLDEITPGTTISYLELARRAASPRGARAVGGACSRNPLPLRLPCHRVVASDGGLGGFTGDLRLKAILLAREAVESLATESVRP
ncbi:MAG: MGMT family protein [Planctomycetota bacterium]